MQVVPLGFETAVAVEDLDAMVLAVGDVDPAIFVAGDVVGRLNCPGSEPGSPHDLIGRPSGVYL